MGMFSFFVMFFLFGVLAQMTVLQDLEHYIADKARRYKQVKVQIHHIGNIDLDIRNIQSVTGIERFQRLARQTIFFKNLVNELVEKIVCYKLEDYYDKKPQIQKDINLFCINLTEINNFLEKHKGIEVSQVDELTDDSVLNRIIKEIEAANNEYVDDISELNKEVTHEINQRGLTLLPKPIPDPRP